MKVTSMNSVRSARMPVTSALMPVLRLWRWGWTAALARFCKPRLEMTWRVAWDYADCLAVTAFDQEWFREVPHPRDALLTDMEYWEGE